MLDQITEPPMAHRVKGSTLAHQVGAMIRKSRKHRGLTLKQLADAIGTTPQTMQRLESANMTLSLDWLEAIARALGLEPWQLINADAIEEANDRAIAAQMKLAAMRAVCRQLCDLVNEIVPEDAGEEGPT